DDSPSQRRVRCRPGFAGAAIPVAAVRGAGLVPGSRPPASRALPARSRRLGPRAASFDRLRFLDARTAGHTAGWLAKKAPARMPSLPVTEAQDLPDQVVRDRCAQL